MKRVFKTLALLICGLLIFIMTSCQSASVVESSSSQKETSTKSEEISNDETEEELTDEDLSGETEIREAKKVLSPMEVLRISDSRDTDKSAGIIIECSKEIQDKFDGSPYIKIEPSVSFTVSKVQKNLIVKGSFDPKQVYKVTVLSGIRAVDGTVSKEEKTAEILFDQKKPKLLFTNDGIILPSVNEKKIYIRSLNVTKMKVIVRKIYANNTTQFLQSFSFSGNGEYWGSIGNVGDELYNVDFDIDNEIDKWVQSAVDLSGVLDSNGFYQIIASFDEDGTTYKFPNTSKWSRRNYISDNGNIQKTILLTDMGIVAEKDSDGYRVNVIDIVNNKVVKNAKVSLMSRNNQVLEEKTTDDNGTALFSEYKNNFYILAENENSKSILTLNNELSTNGFAVDGVFATNGIRGYIYTERGVYRPGDPIYVSIIGRNNNEPLKPRQPVKITVYDPTGVKMIENDVIKNGKNGFYTYTFKTDTSARTGIWKLEATIGDVTINKDISVETVVPNKIKVNLNIPEVVDYNEKITDWTISSNYLFGEPAKGLEYGVSFDIREEPVNFEKFKDYAFDVPSKYSYYASKHLTGKLDDTGSSKLEPKFDDLKFGSLNLLADVSGRVTDDGGRNVLAKKFVKLKKFDTYIGIEKTSTYKKPGSKFDLKVICVTEDGENLVAGKKLKYKIYANDHYWWWDYSDYDRFIRSFKSDKNTKLLDIGEIVTKDTPVLIDKEIPKSEYLYVEIEDEETSQIAGVNLMSSEWVDSSITKKVETLNIIADKKQYSVGDKAELKYRGAANSKAIITIEKAGKIINQFIRDVNSTDMTEKIDITKEMAPNVYVYVTLLQDYKTKENDRPLRLYGIIPLSVVDDDTKIDLEIDAPENIRPNEKFTVNIKNKKNTQFDYTIAVVDEGLLDITNFKTPKPWEYFFQKLAAKLSLFDNYSEVIDRPYGTINQTLTVGGDESLADEMARRKRLKELGLEEAERFKPVSMFKGVLTSDEKGESSVEFEMPNYMGQVRIMLIAANENCYGSVEKDMIVKAPIIVDATLPRSMKVGDKLSIPVSVFALEEGLSNIEVYYTFKGNTQKKNLNFSKGDKEIVYFEEEVGNEISSEKLTVGVKSNLYEYEETVGIAINSNSAPIEVSENAELKGHKEATFAQDLEYVKGTVISVLTISNKMMLGLDKRLKYLIRYPYGCAEQTTSSVFPQLFIEKLSTSKDYDKTEILNNINAGISRLQLFQLSDGSFSYWPGDSETSDYATNYIGHFLVCAKKNGYYVPDSMYDAWLNYTSKKVRGTSIGSDYDINWKCYALYLLALAGKENVSEMNYMYENYFKLMNQTTKMYLAAAYKLAGEEQVAKTVASNINLVSIKKMFDDIYKRDRYYYNYSYGSLLREVAVYLDCYYTVFGKRDDEAFDEILTSLRSKDWYSTQTTAYSLVALSNMVNQDTKDEIKGVVEIDGEKTEYTTQDQHRVVIKEDAKEIKVIPDTDGMTYVNYFWEGVPINSEVEDYSDGFSIERNYYDDEGKAFDASSTKSGNTFWIEVIVKPTKRNMDRIENIALTQVLPSGWEIENLRVTDTKAPKWVEEKSKDTRVTYTDIRDDRVMWFFNYSNDKEYRFFVKINSVTKGEFDFPGTTLEAMYDNTYKAYKKGGKIKVN